jgi:hypothetical protein
MSDFHHDGLSNPRTPVKSFAVAAGAMGKKRAIAPITKFEKRMAADFLSRRAIVGYRGTSNADANGANRGRRGKRC